MAFLFGNRALSRLSLRIFCIYSLKCMCTSVSRSVCIRMHVYFVCMCIICLFLYSNNLHVYCKNDIIACDKKRSGMSMVLLNILFSVNYISIYFICVYMYTHTFVSRKYIYIYIYIYILMNETQCLLIFFSLFIIF